MTIKPLLALAVAAMISAPAFAADDAFTAGLLLPMCNSSKL